KQVMNEKFGESNLKDHFADTRDTLCYATNDNQDASYELLKTGADLAIVVGGYNSSNTSHIVELCEQKFPTYFISSETEIISKEKIKHFDFHNQKNLSTENYLAVSPLSQRRGVGGEAINIILTSGASGPDAVV